MADVRGDLILFCPVIPRRKPPEIFCIVRLHPAKTLEKEQESKGNRLLYASSNLMQGFMLCYIARADSL
jgi:hypothetical protein